MQIDPDVLDAIRSAEVDGPAFRLRGQLDRNPYERVNLALHAVGGTWYRYKRAHVFPVAAVTAVAGLLATGQVITDAERGYYPTPEPIVEQLLDLSRAVAWHGTLLSTEGSASEPRSQCPQLSVSGRSKQGRGTCAAWAGSSG